MPAFSVRQGMIAWVGPMAEWSQTLPDDVTELDAAGKVVLPGFVDSHTHMMFAGNRAHEFALRSRAQHTSKSRRKAAAS